MAVPDLSSSLRYRRKAGPFADGELPMGVWGLDITNGAWYFSTDGLTVTELPQGLSYRQVLSIARRS